MASDGVILVQIVGSGPGAEALLNQVDALTEAPIQVLPVTLPGGGGGTTPTTPTPTPVTVVRIGYQRDGLVLHILAEPSKDNALMEMRLRGRNATQWADTAWYPAETWETTRLGLTYHRKRSYQNVPNGDYAIESRIKGSTAAATSQEITLSDGQTPTQPVQEADFRMYQKRDGGTKSLELFALVPDNAEYVCSIEPTGGQAWTGTDERAMVAGTYNEGGVSWNRRYLYAPSFVQGGIDVPAGSYKVRGKKKTDASFATVASMTLTNLNSAGEITPADSVVTNPGSGGNTGGGNTGGGTTGSGPYGFDWTPLAETARPSDNKIVVTTTGNIRLENWLHWGGAFCSLSGPGFSNMINIADLGRELGIAVYDKDSKFSRLGYEPHSAWENIGYNPLDCGDVYENRNDIISYGYRASDGMHYVKTRPRQWPLNNYPTEMYYEKWFKAVGPNAIRVWHRTTHFRTDKAVQPACQEHETPYFHTIDTSSRYVFYEGDAPWTNGPLTYKDGFDSGGNPTEDRLSRKVSEPWIAGVNSAGVGGGICGPGGYNQSIRMHGGGGTGPTAGKTGYMNFGETFILDAFGTEHFCYDVMGGTVDQMRAWAKSQFENVDNRPHYVFNTKSRYRFDLEKAYDGGVDTITEAWSITSRTGQIRIATPAKAFPAAGITNIYVTMKNGSNRTDFLLAFVKAGQSVDSASQQIAFTCPADNQYHQIAIPVSTLNTWSGQIVKLHIMQAGVREEQQGGGRIWHIKRISYLLNDPSTPVVEQPNNTGGGGNTGGTGNTAGPANGFNGLANQTVEGVNGGGYECSNPNYLKPTYRVEGDEIVITGDVAITDRSRYIINSDGYYPSIIGMRFPALWPLLIIKIEADFSREQKYWRDNPVINGECMIRVK